MGSRGGLRDLRAAAPALACVAVAAIASGCGGTTARRPGAAATTAASPPAAVPPAAAPSRHRFAVGLIRIRLVDRSRVIRLPGHGREPRTLVTYVRYPASGAPSAREVAGAPPDRSAAPYPLVVFGHGFQRTPKPYSRLLHAWASAGYVVAAPTFPLENANAPGGPDENDLVNQPDDVSFVISRLIAISAAGSGAMRGLVDPRHIAAAGHSDGGETALAATYDRGFRDPRIDAAVILSGARIPGTDVLAFGPRSRPLLAAQGTADVVNPPHETYAFFAAARRPKYLLKLLGAAHEPPYESQQPQLGIVERVTIAFLDRYLGGRSVSARRLQRLGNVNRLASLTAAP